ncbi:hypothetical protein RHSIM_Rhsim09G0092400 [Rhododendron simsii]|uniref:Uncharacterized protein n=1 Tax=Rhododendron simsii TaxID=118357 RepID=A0A834GEP1_RHOSS|nr:hypothetical protein RHSIM_Rhsim09G0092400 [Rhododendron simsii]
MLNDDDDDDCTPSTEHASASASALVATQSSVPGSSSTQQLLPSPSSMPIQFDVPMSIPMVSPSHNTFGSQARLMSPHMMFSNQFQRTPRGFNRGPRFPRRSCDICGKTNHITNFCYYRPSMFDQTSGSQWRGPFQSFGMSQFSMPLPSYGVPQYGMPQSGGIQFGVPQFSQFGMPQTSGIQYGGPQVSPFGGSQFGTGIPMHSSGYSRNTMGASRSQHTLAPGLLGSSPNSSAVFPAQAHFTGFPSDSDHTIASPGGLYPLLKSSKAAVSPGAAFVSIADNTMLWHRKLGHPYHVIMSANSPPSSAPLNSVVPTQSSPPLSSMSATSSSSSAPLTSVVPPQSSPQLSSRFVSAPTTNSSSIPTTFPSQSQTHKYTTMYSSYSSSTATDMDHQKHSADPPQLRSGNPPVQTPPPGTEAPWSTGLFSCFDDVPNCCITCWCPCITFGQIAEIADERAISKLGSKCSNIHTDRNFHGVCVLLLMLLSYEAEEAVQVERKPLCRLLCPLVLRVMCVVSRVSRAQKSWIRHERR